MSEAGKGLLAALMILLSTGAAAMFTPTAAAQASTANVDVSGNAFMPASITVLVGTTVTWTQKDSVEHTVTADDNQPETWDQGLLLPMNAAGILNDFEHTFENLGTTAYHCEVHANMVAEVIVVESFESPFVTVNANDANEFSPEEVVLNVSQGILWINSGSVGHTVTFEDSSIGDLGELAAGSELRFNFTAPGSFRYRCTYHSRSDFESGMVGKIVVGGNASFPPVLIIDSPEDNASLNGTVEVTARLIRGSNATALEYNLDESDNWTAINATSDLDEFEFSFEFDADTLEPGNHTLTVRAVSGNETIASDSVELMTTHEHGHDESNEGTPAPGFLLALACLGLAFLRRRDA